MIGHCLWYENRLPEAVDEARSARDEALRSGVAPVQVFAQTTLTQLLTESSRDEEADASGAEALELARRTGSRRYEATLLMFAADRHLRQGHRGRANDDLAAAFALSHQTGLGFIGAALHGRMARAALGAEERSRCIAEGQALLGQTGLAHNHLWFYRDAIEARLAAGEWSLALEQADAFERLFTAEPLPWVLLLVERARSIAEAMKAPGDPAAMMRLKAARVEVEAAAMRWALPGIDAALATA